MNEKENKAVEVNDEKMERVTGAGSKYEEPFGTVGPGDDAIFDIHIYDNKVKDRGEFKFDP